MTELAQWALRLDPLAWPLAFMLAWALGELGHRWTGLPRISVYGLTGFLLGQSQLGLLPATSSSGIALLAHVAFGLILFELGYRVNLHWLRANPWMAVTAVAESTLTFALVFWAASAYDMSTLNAWLLAALSMSTSPAALLRVVNEQRSSGQVTERALHLTAINCVLSVFVFKVVVGFWTYQTSGSLGESVWNSLVVLSASAALGAAFGVGVPRFLHRLGTGDATVGYAVALVLLVSITHSLKLSPVLAALTLGVMARHRRLTLNQAQRNFGALGDLLAVVLFVFASATIEWQRAWAGLALGLALIAVRSVAKVVATGLFARVAGVSWRKGVWTGLAMTPMSVFVILLLEQTRFLGIDLVDQLAPLAAATLLLELIGPLVTQKSLHASGETIPPRKD